MTTKNAKSEKLEALKRSLQLLQVDDIDENQLDQNIKILNLKEIRVKADSMINFEPD
ncbi:hypothetical protein [Alkanindiges illinoisensis]|uniref:hypothetical protein n=1 Tax=Alkanindiges illinoisensis TaxID=197183 RepID=UPI0012ECA6A3|nr:hypothetical protein [Alkanindiges illinoisensis]